MITYQTQLKKAHAENMMKASKNDSHAILECIVRSKHLLDQSHFYRSVTEIHEAMELVEQLGDNLKRVRDAIIETRHAVDNAELHGEI